MKNTKKLLIVAMAVLLVASLAAVAACTPPAPQVTGIKVTSQPTKTEYIVGESFDPAGMVVKKVFDDETEEALAAADYTIDKTGALAKTDTKVTITYKVSDEKQFTADVTISVVDDYVTTVAVNTQPTTLTYGHRQGIADVSLAGGKLDVTWKSGKTEVVDMSDDMKPADESPEWKIGSVSYSCSYQGKSFDISVEYQNQALDIATFNSAETENGKYDITGIVVGPINTANRAELLLKAKDSMNFIGVGGFEELIGGYGGVQFNFTNIKVGDEVIVAVSKGVNSKALAIRAYAETTVAEFNSKTIVVSHDNAITYDLTGAVEVNDLATLTSFVTDSTRAWKIAKITDAYAFRSNNEPGSLRLYYGEPTGTAGCKINKATPWVPVDIVKYYTEDTDGFMNNIFPGSSAATQEDFTNRLHMAEGSAIYVMCVGGTSTLTPLNILDPSWIVAPAAAG